MKRNISTPHLKGVNNFMPINLSSTNQKKLHGYDTLLKPTTASNFAKTSSSFNQKIEQLKSKPNKKTIEDQYIKGLQDQLHYLQLQLKLLQEKDQAKHGQIDQLERFFSDGVPINENILAIKNGFNNYKNTAEKKIIELANEKKQRETLIGQFKNRIKQMSKQLQTDEKNIRVFESSKAQQYHDLIKTEAKLKKQIQLQDDELKLLKTNNRKMNQKLSSLHRTKEIQMVMTLKNQNHKMDKLNKIKQSIQDKQIQYEELEKVFEELAKQEEEKSYVLKIEQENLNLKKKAIAMERELNALQTKAQEKQMQLDLKLKERHKEITAKTQMKTRVDVEKSKIAKENQMKVQDIEKVAKQKQIALLQKIIARNKKLSKYTEYYGNLLSKVEDQIQKMVEKKPQLKSQINAYKAEVKRLAETIQVEKTRQYEIYSQGVQAEAKQDHLKNIIPPLQEKIEKSSEQIKYYKSQKEKLSQDIKVKEKQLDLLLILKSLNIQEVEMSKSSSSNIQDRVIQFIRSWQQLQRNS